MRVTSRDPAATPLDLPTTAGVTFKLLSNNEFITQGGGFQPRSGGPNRAPTALHMKTHTDTMIAQMKKKPK
jgi:hypothetical protein